MGIKTETIEERLTWLWANGHKQGIKSNAEKICTVGIEETRTMLGDPTGHRGAIQFDRWYDSDIFHFIKDKRYVIKPEYLHLGISYSRGGGSAWIEFNPEKIEEVVAILQKHGYKIQRLEDK